MTSNHSRLRSLFFPDRLLFEVADWDSATEPQSRATPTVSFRLASTAQPLPGRPAESATLTAALTAAGPLRISGPNGVLTLEDVRLIVDEFELQRAEESSDHAENEDIRKRRAAPRHFVAVRLNGGHATVVMQDVPLGTYAALKLAIKSRDGEDLGPAVLEEARPQFADWPAEACVRVIGTFDPTDSDPRRFRVFFDGEVTVEFEFPQEKPLVIGAGSQPTITAFVDPATWFVNTEDDSVIDLSQFDFDQTSQTVSLSAKFQDGFSTIEVDA